jgi:hypothetical protein
MRIATWFLGLLLASVSLQAAWIDEWRARNPVWRGAHLLINGPAAARDLEAALPALQQAGLNTLIVQIDYGFAFDSHPEVRGGAVMSKEDARRLTQTCHGLGIRLIPQFSCLGHQSWAGATGPLLTQHPEFDETPGQFPGNQGIYCRSWCPRAPGREAFIRDLLDELVEAFNADAFHVGLDEVFLLGSEHCLRCRGVDPATLFAETVQELHTHLVGRRKVEMLMWSDRLLDAKTTGLGEWEAAKNGTAPAIDRIPKDIVQCDWHYEPLSAYPGKPKEYGSLRLLADKGFRVWPSTWKRVAPTQAFLAEARGLKHPRMLGPLVTTWGAVKPGALATWEPLQAALSTWRETP